MTKPVVLLADRPSSHTNIRTLELWDQLQDIAEWKYLYSQYRLLRGIQRRILFPVRISCVTRNFNFLWCWGLQQIEYFKGQVIVDIDDPNFSNKETERLNKPNVHMVVTTTQQLKERLIKSGCEKDIRVIPSGWNPERLRKERRTDGEKRPLVIGCCTPYLLEKDLKILLDTLDLITRKLDDFEIWLIGAASPWLKDLKYRQIKLLGYVPHKELLNYISKFDIALYPRAVDYGGRFSIKLIEYLGCGIPVVANLVSESFLVQDSRGGIVVDKSGFGEAILQLAHNPGLRKELGEKGREFAKNYSWKEISRRYRQEVFKCLLMAN